MKFNWNYRALSVVSGLVAALAVSRPARADEPLPGSLVKASQASSGKTELATAGFERGEKPADEAKDATELQLAAGGLASAGNSRTMAVTSSGSFRVRRVANQIGGAIAANSSSDSIFRFAIYTPIRFACT